MAPRRIAIAIDGPASSGKGTVARRVAQELGYGYADTGALYRSVGLGVLRRGGEPSDPVVAEAVARALDVRFTWEAGRLKVEVGGEDVSAAIRTEPVSKAASAVAVHPGVRAALLDTQRRLGEDGGVVMDGRDVGTVVLPGAELKIYLDASLEERARRRLGDLPGADYAEVLREMAARDAQDAGRATAPLRRADDAVYLDTTGLTPDEVVARIVALAHTRGA